MIKKAYEECWYYREFKRPDGAGWLNASETVSSATVTLTDASGADMSSMVSGVNPNNSTQVIFMLKGGTAGQNYDGKIRVVTSNSQKFESDFTLEVT
jgi:hypothetical protein